MDAEADVLADLFGKKKQPAEAPAEAPAARAVSADGQVASGAARPWIALALAGATGLISILAGLWAAGFLAGTFGEDGASPPVVEAIYALSIFGPMLLLAWVGARMMKSPGAGIGKAGGRHLLVGFALGIGGLMIAALYSAIAQVASTESALPPIYVWLFAGTVLTIIQCSAEEMLLRGWLQPVLAEHWHSWIAVIAAALLFAALHLLGGARSPLTLVNLLLAGFFFGLLALRTGGIAAPIAAHFGWNWSEALLLGLDVNPGVGSYGALFNLDLSGSSWWGGSQEGLNSSIGVTFVLLALVTGCAGPFGRRRANFS